MKEDSKGKGLFSSLFGGMKKNKGSSCCNFVIEDIQEETEKKLKEKDTKQNTKKSCCS